MLNQTIELKIKSQVFDSYPIQNNQQHSAGSDFVLWVSRKPKLSYTFGISAKQLHGGIIYSNTHATVVQLPVKQSRERAVPRRVTTTVLTMRKMPSGSRLALTSCWYPRCLPSLGLRFACLGELLQNHSVVVGSSFVDQSNEFPAVKTNFLWWWFCNVSNAMLRENVCCEPIVIALLSSSARSICAMIPTAGGCCSFRSIAERKC